MSATSPSMVSGEPPRIFSRELVLLLCVLALLVLLAVSALFSRLYHKKVHTLADAMFAQGEADEQAARQMAGEAKTAQLKLALTDYRNALAYNPGNPLFQFHLAKALAAAGRDDEARSYLVNLLSEAPGSGEINLELARISARQRAWLDAVRYYHSAIYGVWNADPLVQRWNVRKELCQFLLDRGDAAGAQPEVLALAQEVPPGDIQRQKEAAALLLRTGLWTRALQDFQAILKQSRGDQDALEGAAIASYQLNKYAQALDYFDSLHRNAVLDQNA